MGRPHEAKIELGSQNNNPSLWRALSHLPDHLKHVTGVLAALIRTRGMAPKGWDGRVMSL